VRHRYAEIARALDVEEEAAELAAKRIARLNPDPGSGFSHAELNIITPDLILEYEGHEPKLNLTADSSPQVVLSSEYREMMAEHADKPEVRSYLSRCFREVRELIRALGDRQTTLLLVAKAIAEKQASFFRGKAESIKPLKMEEVAEATQLHISTISRAVRGKYMQTPRGVFELRSLFTTALNTAADTEMSADEIKSKIRRYI
jgi:RNA polymerase sigma-54 factor